MPDSQVAVGDGGSMIGSLHPGHSTCVGRILTEVVMVL